MRRLPDLDFSGIHKPALQHSLWDPLESGGCLGTLVVSRRLGHQQLKHPSSATKHSPPHLELKSQVSTLTPPHCHNLQPKILRRRRNLRLAFSISVVNRSLPAHLHLLPPLRPRVCSPTLENKEKLQRLPLRQRVYSAILEPKTRAPLPPPRLELLPQASSAI